VREIVVDAVDPDTMALWETVARLSRSFEERKLSWCLVGGMMVALFAMDSNQTTRPTTDIDILGNARSRPSATKGVAGVLRDLGATGPKVGGFDGERGFRFEVDGHDVDVLAPDGLKGPAMIDAQFETIQIPGGTQALQRTESVTVILDGVGTLVRRPTLLGAILLKVRSLMVHSDPEAQREDLVTLLSLMSDPRQASAELKSSERNWLNDARARLALDDEELASRFAPEVLRAARAAYQIVTS
jgi:hypothetical protein